MDQSKSSEAIAQSEIATIQLPKRTLTVEFWVGLFAMAGVACAGYLAIGLGDVRIFETNKYELYAEFDNIAGLKTGASVEIAGVQVGEVVAIDLKDPAARVTLRLDSSVKIKDDDIATIRTKGIIGDRYVKISRGASDNYFAAGQTIVETESVVDFEDIVGKIVHSLGADDEKTETTNGK